MRPIKNCFDLTDKQIGFWKVIKQTDCPPHIESENSKRKSWWLCKCNCGRESFIKGGTLRSGRSLSCGCRLIKNHYQEIYYRK